MDRLQLAKLERNLTKSARLAKPCWVRGMVGRTESDQGFFSIEIIPVFNPIQNKETTLKELITDAGELNVKHTELKEAHEALVKLYNDNVKAQTLKNNELMENMDTLNERIKNLEISTLE